MLNKAFKSVNDYRKELFTYIELVGKEKKVEFTVVFKFQVELR